MEKTYRTRRLELENSFLYRLFWPEKKKKRKILELANEEYGHYLGKYYLLENGNLLYIKDIVLWKNKDSGKLVPALKASVLKEVENGFTVYIQLIPEHDYKIELDTPSSEYTDVQEKLHKNLEKMINYFNIKR